MHKRSVLALLAIATFAAAVLVGLGASTAFAGEVTGNCNKSDVGTTPNDNCKTEYSNGNSWCRFSGQNDKPDSTDPNDPGGNVQNWGHTAQPGTDVDPSD